jgi:DNA-directed RNA polymerase subunit beta
LAASRPAKTISSSSAFAPRRVSFGRITEHLEVPNLLAIQTASFDWLVGNENWQARNADVSHARSGLAEILDEISPIEDFSGTMSLSFSAPRFDEVKASIEECKEKDLTYCAPLFVTAEFTNHSTGEIKSQTVFMGDFPIMTPKGTFTPGAVSLHAKRPSAPPVLGRTHLGSFPPCEDQFERIRSPPGLLRQDHRTP